MRTPLFVGLAAVLLAVPAVASEPSTSEVTAADPAAEVTWSGTIPPGVGEAVNCTQVPGADTHTLTLAIPDGATAALTITQTYEHDGTNDPEMAIRTPSGDVVEVDATFGATEETHTFADAEPGEYTIYHCHYAGGATDYAATASAKAKAGAGGAADPTITTGTADTCAAPADVPAFEMAYIDEGRAGGEPILTVHPDGQLLWGSHAGTTHFYSPASPSPTSGAFVENYQGQTYYYVSEDGATFDFVSRTPIDAADVQAIAGVPLSGFSDPEFAIDQAGNVYISEINLANVAVSKSTDGGRTYTLQNVFAFTGSDRQWMAADRENELYMSANGFGGGPFPGEPAPTEDGHTPGPVGNLGHFLAKSTDGGQTWNGASYTNTEGIGDLQIDQQRGILYELAESGGALSIARYPKVRDELTNFTVEKFTIVEGLGLTAVQRLIDPTLDIDADGNLYVVWSDNGSGEGGRAEGVYYAYSTDRGETWSAPLRVDPDDRDIVWPWLAVGAPGNVAIGWLQSDQATDAVLPGEAGGTAAKWDVAVAVTTTGLGCGGDAVPGFAVTTASSEPIHTGTICQHGTTCQTDLTDRRLGDYFSLEVDQDGRIHVAVSDTRQGGAVALPLHIRQTSGVRLDGVQPVPEGGGEPTPAPAPAPAPAPPSLPTTGGGALAAALLAFGASRLVARRRQD